MATETQTWLERYSDAKLAFTLVFDGYDLAFTTVDDVTAIASAFSGDGAPWEDVTNIKTGLHLAGEMRQQIELFTPDVKAGTLDFTITEDNAGDLALMFRAGFSESASKTFLTGDVDAGDASDIPVKNVDALGSTSGHVYIGHEKIGFTSVDGTIFINKLEGITRGVGSIFKTDDGTPFAPSHKTALNATNTAATAPSVGMTPRTWYGRMVSLFLHHYDPVARAWSPPSESRRLWSGRIERYRTDLNGSVTITAKHVMQELAKPILANQWSAALSDGRYLGPYDSTLWLFNSASPSYSLVADLALDGYYTHDELARIINDQFIAWQEGGDLNADEAIGLAISTSGRSGSLSYKYKLQSSSAPSESLIFVGLSYNAHDLLGGVGEAIHNIDDPNGQPIRMMALRPDGSASGMWSRAYSNPPIVHSFNPDELGINSVSAEIGEWVDQDVLPGTGANGVISVNDEIWAVKRTTLESGVALQTLAYYFRDRKIWTFFTPDVVRDKFKAHRLGESGEVPRAKQVFLTSGLAGDKLLELLLSTGSAGYNHADYDTLQASMGVGVPCSLVNVDSFRSLNDAEIELLIDKPIPFYDLIEPFLAITGRYIVWKSTGSTTEPKITVVEPAYESAFLAAWNLDDSNKSGAAPGRPDRASVDYAADGIINRVSIEYGHDSKGENPTRVILDDNASQTDHGRRKTVEIKATGIRNAESLIPKLVAPVFAYLSRPLVIIERSIDISLTRMAPGDAVALTEPALVDPVTGEQGVVVYCWCLGVSFDFKTGRGACQLVFLPERDPSRVGMWAPSAMVDDDATNAGYNAGTQTLTCKEHRFSDDAGGVPVDAARFVEGDAVHIYALRDGSPAPAALGWETTVASVSGNTITLDDPLTGWDSARFYVVEYQTIGNLTNQAQFYGSFIADKDTDETTEGQPYEYGADPTSAEVATWAPSYLNGVCDVELADADAFAQDQPISAHKASLLTDSVNALLSYNTRPVYVNDHFDPVMASPVTIAGTHLIWTMWIPFYGHVGFPGNRTLVAYMSAYADTSTVASTVTYHLVSTPVPVANARFREIAAKSSVSFARSTSGYEMSGELELEPVVSGGNAGGLNGTWLSVFAEVEDSALYAMNYLHVAEKAL